MESPARGSGDDQRDKRVLWSLRLREAGFGDDLSEHDPRLIRLVSTLQADEDQLASAKATIDGFATQMAECFDTLEALYSIGRGMHDIAHPRSFLELVTSRLHAVLQFGWLGVAFGNLEQCAAAYRGGMQVQCHPDVHLLTVQRWLRGAPARFQSSTVLEGQIAPLGGTSGQVLLQPIVVRDQVIGVLAAGCKSHPDPVVSSYDTQVIEAASGFFSAFCNNVVLYEEQRDMFMGTVKALTAAIDAKDPYTRGHSERVAAIAERLAQAIGMSGETLEFVKLAGLVHDIGKIGVPERVLLKAGKLDEAEFALMKQHPEIGHRILSGIPPLARVLPAVLHHHERFDGRGYPLGLAGNDIPLAARILSVADTFDAMSSSRSYRSAMSRDRVFSEIERSSGTQLDPMLAARFLKMPLDFYDSLAEFQASQREAA